MKQRIMIVDDDATMLNLLEVTLSEAGYSVMAFKSAVDAFDHINTHPKSIDLLVIDYSMPLMSGFELAQELKTFVAGAANDVGEPKLPYAAESRNIRFRKAGKIAPELRPLIKPTHAALRYP